MKKGTIKNTSSVLLFLCIFVINSSIISGQISHSVDFSKIKLDISLSKAEDGNEYQVLKNDKLNCISDVVGSPEIPVKIIKLIIPAGQEVKNIIITSKSKELVKLQKLILPVQYGIPTSINNKKKPFVKPDGKIYESDNPYPEKLVHVLHDGYFDGSNHIVDLAIYPFQYYPKENKLELFSNINFMLEMSPGGLQPLIYNNSCEEKQKNINELLMSMVDNPEDIPLYQLKHGNSGGLLKTTSVPVGIYDYVIVTTSSLSPAFNKFVQWKKRKGIRIYIKTIDAILIEYNGGDLVSGIDDNAGKLRQFLKDAKENNYIEYALLAGDISNIPFRYGCGFCNTWDYDTLVIDGYHVPTDFYFSDFNGDWDVDGDDPDGVRRYGEWNGVPPYIGDRPDYYAEISVGRLLFQTQQEVLNWTDKLIEYEQNPFNGSYDKLTKFLWSESDEMQSENEVSYVKGQSLDISSTPTTSFIISEEPSFDHITPNAPYGAEIITKLNEGYHFYGIYNHGNPWSAMVRCPGIHQSGGSQYGIMTYDSSDNWYTVETGNGLDNITNNSKSTIIYSIGCDNAQYDAGVRCMADVFTTLGNSGGTAFIGNTRFGLIKQSNSFHYKFLQGLFYIPSRIYNLGKTLTFAKENIYTSNKQFFIYDINLFGDPEMPVWTATPTQFSGTSITYNTSSVTVNAGISGCTITACSMDNGAGFHSIQNGVSSYTFIL